MIVDKIKNIDIYINLSDGIFKGLNVLKDPGLFEKEDGKYEIDGDNIFYLVQRYKTKNVSEAKFEAHRKYIDIQAILKGKEIIGYTHKASLKVSIPYTDDIEFFETPRDFNETKLTEGMFVILFPDDAHMPMCHYNEQSDVLKVVVKIKM